MSEIITTTIPDNAIRFVIPGDPKAQKRHKHTGRGGFVRVYNPSDKDKKTIATECIRELGPGTLIDPQLTGPVGTMIAFYFKRPKSRVKLKEYWHSIKPDADNCEKLFNDALESIKCVIKNDSQIAFTIRSKKYTDDEACTEVTIWELEG